MSNTSNKSLPSRRILLCKALTEADVDHEFILYDNAPHGIDPGTGTDAGGWIDKAIEFWKR